MKHTGWGHLHFTVSAWETEDDLKNFARSGAHLAAMQLSRELSHEIRIYTCQGTELPRWPDAKHMLFEKGKVILL